jgi:DNA-binding NtrC family response regulator
MNRKILVVDDCESAAQSLALALERDYDVTALCGCDGILPALSSRNYEMLVINVGLLRGRCGDFLEELIEANPQLIILAIGAAGSFDLADEAIQSGAMGYFSRPFSYADFYAVVKSRLPPRDTAAKQEEPPWKTSLAPADTVH